MTPIDISALLVAAIYSLVPIVLGFTFRFAWAEVSPYAIRYLGQKNYEILQGRVDAVLQSGIGYAVQHGAEYVSKQGPIPVETKNWMVGLAVNYAVQHAPDLMQEAGNVTEKVLARFDTHPAVQALVTPGAPAEPVTSDRAA